jgi:plastocyanin
MSTTLFLRAIRAMRPALLVVVVAGAAAIAGCGGSSAKSSSVSHNNAASATPAQGGAEGSVENVSMKIAGGKMAKALGYTTDDGKGHDTYIPSELKVKAGSTIKVTVSNYDEGPHTFTSPDLGVNATIAPATNATKKIPSKTTFTIVVKKAGKFRWYCALPCDAKAAGWAMTPGSSGPDQDKYMAGYVVAS